MVVTLTYEDLAAIANALFLATEEATQSDFRAYIHAWLRVSGALHEAEDIEPKPQFMLTHEGE